MKTNIVMLEDLVFAMDSYLGWCKDCKDFTRECTEPDAEDYDCPECGGNNVIGAEQAMLTGIITTGE